MKRHLLRLIRIILVPFTAIDALSAKVGFEILVSSTYLGFLSCVAKKEVLAFFEINSV